MVSTIARADGYYDTPGTVGQIYGTGQLDRYCAGQLIANYGASTQFGYLAPNPSTDSDPQFYSALEAHTTLSCPNAVVTNDVYHLHISVSATDPNGNPVTGGGNAFLPIGDGFAPQSSGGTYEPILNFLFNLLVNAAPYGIASTIVNQASHPSLSSGYQGCNCAWADWQKQWYDTNHTNGGLYFSFKMAVEPQLHGTYTLTIRYHVEVEGGVEIDSADVVQEIAYCFYTCSGNVPVPTTPSTPSGYTWVYVGNSEYYSTTANSPAGYGIEYMFSWGDGSTTTTGYGVWGTSISAAHSWAYGGYFYVKVRASSDGTNWTPWSPSLQVYVDHLSNCPPHC